MPTQKSCNSFFEFLASVCKGCWLVLQANDRLKRRVQQLLTSRAEFTLAAANRMQASKKKANMLRSADWQVGSTKWKSQLYFKQYCEVLVLCPIMSASAKTKTVRSMSVERFVLYIVPATPSGRNLSCASCRGLQIDQNSHHNNVHHDAAEPKPP